MTTERIAYTASGTTARPFEETVVRARDLLEGEGFGVLCEIDVQATLRQKLGVERDPYLILGACNPELADRALTAEPELGALLPCNLVVFRGAGVTHVSAVDAERLLSLVGNSELQPVAEDVRARLGRVVAALVEEA